jgi:hypothetical protein
MRSNSPRRKSTKQLLHLYSGLLGVAPSAVGVDFRWFADPIPHGRDAQRPEFAVGLRYEHASDRPPYRLAYFTDRNGPERSNRATTSPTDTEGRLFDAAGDM